MSVLAPASAVKRKIAYQKTWEGRWESCIPPHPDLPRTQSISRSWKTVPHQDANVIFILWTPFCNHFRTWFLLQHSPFWIRASSFAAGVDDNSRLTVRCQILRCHLCHLTLPCGVGLFLSRLWSQPLFRNQAGSWNRDSPNKNTGSRTAQFTWRILFWHRTRNKPCVKTAGQK